MTDENRALVAHLFRRAAFGARPADLGAYASRPYTAAVDDLLAAARQAASATSSTAEPMTEPHLVSAQQAWLHSMVVSTSPLLERMILFLSNHFATAYDTSVNVDAASLTSQHAKFRKYGLGSFADLAHAMIDDKALACYLNNDRNRLEHPNENLARELMELFMLGPGNYSESDVKEAARALTGYKLQLVPPNTRPSLVYKDTLHDDGLKTILGVTARFKPHDLVDVLLKQPAAPRFIATKLVSYFVSSPPDDALVTTVANTLRYGWDLGAAVQTILYSTQFQSLGVRQVLAKTPGEYVAGLMRGLGGRTEYAQGITYMNAAGQILFKPPTVAGWDLGRRMLGPGAMLARYKAGAYFANLQRTSPIAGLPTDPNIASWSEAFGMTSLSTDTNDALTTYLDSTKQQPTPVRVAGLITLLLSSSDFNLS